MNTKLVISSFLLSAFASFSSASIAQNLLDKRADFQTSIVKEVRQQETLETPPSNHPFQLVEYKTKLGKMAAYLTRPPSDAEQKLPAIIWITGGHPQGGASPSFVEGAPYKNNQTANMFYERGVITMYPTFRGTYGNPGKREEFYGEVNDVLSALEFLKKQKHIDQKQIYLGGHSTGATLALLAAAASDEFAGVLALGPQDDVKNHGGGGRLFDTNNATEFELRAPISHLSSIKTPTYVIEGEFGASSGLTRMREKSNNSAINFWLINGADHFDIIQSTSDLFADAIIEKSKNRASTFEFNEKQVTQSYQTLRVNMMRAIALQHLARASANGVDIHAKQTLTHYFYSEYKGSIDEISKALKAAKFTSIKSESTQNSEGTTLFSLTAQRKQKPSDLEQLFSDQALFERLDKKWSFSYENWYPEG